MRSREQDTGALGAAFKNTLLVVADGLLEFLVDRDGRFALHLGVEIPQVEGSFAAVSVIERPEALSQWFRFFFGFDLGHDVPGKSA